MNAMRHRWIAMLVAISAAGAGAGWAQDVSPARTAERAAERAEELDAQATPRQEGDPVIAESLQRRELPPPGGPRVLLRDVEFEPDSAFLSDAELAALTAPYLGKRLDFREISRLVRDVNDLYAERGIVTAAAILPPQDLSTGNLRIALVEGRLGGVSIVGQRETSSEFILDRVQMTRGDNVVDVPRIAQDLTYFNRTSRAKLRMLLQPGAAFGLTDLAFGITEPPRDQLEFYIDNTGLESTGEAKVAALFRRYGLAARDDTLLAFLELSRGSQALVLRYDTPINTRNTRLDLGLTASRIEVIDGPAEPLDVTGDSLSASAGLSHPLFVDDAWIVQATGSLFVGRSNSAAVNVPLVETRTRKVAAGLRFGYSKGPLDGSGALQLVHASVDDLISDDTRDITLAIGSVDGRYRFAEDLSLRARGTFQWTDEDLLPGNLLYQIGGPATVRGYPADGIAGDRGYLLSFELHKTLDWRDMPVGLFGFLDYGKIYSTFPASTDQGSIGLGVSYDLTETATLDVTAAFPFIDAVSNQDDLVIYATLKLVAF